MDNGCFYIRLGTLSLTTCDVSLFPPVLSKLSIDEGGEGDACGKSISQLRKSDVPVNQATMDGFIGFLIFAKRCKLSARKLPPIDRYKERTLESDENARRVFSEIGEEEA